jgi:hypothetical protein
MTEIRRSVVLTASPPWFAEGWIEASHHHRRLAIKECRWLETGKRYVKESVKVAEIVCDDGELALAEWLAAGGPR